LTSTAFLLDAIGLHQFWLVSGLFWLVGSLVVGLLVVLWNGAASALLVREIVFCMRGRPVRFMPLLETALAR
jgi:hypothetical protein